MIYLIAVLVLVDMWFVNKRYFNNENFSKPKDILKEVNDILNQGKQQTNLIKFWDGFAAERIIEVLIES